MRGRVKHNAIQVDFDTKKKGKSAEGYGREGDFVNVTHGEN